MKTIILLLFLLGVIYLICAVVASSWDILHWNGWVKVLFILLVFTSKLKYTE